VVEDDETERETRNKVVGEWIHHLHRSIVRVNEKRLRSISDDDSLSNGLNGDNAFLDRPQFSHFEQQLHSDHVDANAVSDAAQDERIEWSNHMRHRIDFDVSVVQVQNR
jgi:hypothetical protein